MRQQLVSCLSAAINENPHFSAQFNKMPHFLHLHTCLSPREEQGQSERKRDRVGRGKGTQHMRRLRIQQCMKFKKFQAHKPQWPRLSRLDIYYLPVWPQMKLWPLSSSTRTQRERQRERDKQREREWEGDGILTSRRCSFAVDVAVDGICMPGWPFNVSVSVSSDGDEAGDDANAGTELAAL